MNGRGLASQPQGLGSTLGFQNGVTLVAENLHLGLAHRRVVIDDQQRPAGFGYGR
jgi:hypothetical protein